MNAPLDPERATTASHTSGSRTDAAETRTPAAIVNVFEPILRKRTQAYLPLNSNVGLADECRGLTELEAQPGLAAAAQLAQTSAETEHVPELRDPQPARPEGRFAQHAAQPPPKRSGAKHATRTSYLDRHGRRFILFAAIGGGIFLAGFALQAALTGGAHLPAFLSYLIQSITSVEASFLLNRWLTWRDRDTPFWAAFGRYNLQKTITVALNLAAYYGLLRTGMNYLLANIVLTAIFTVVNYIGGDRFVFTPAKILPTPPVPASTAHGPRPAPTVSVVIPVRDNQQTIGETVRSLLNQDYPGLREVVLVGSPGDHTWGGLAGLQDARITILETETPPGMRDANFKRDFGIRRSCNSLIALVDSDIVLPPDWMSTAVITMQDTGAPCVAGSMRSIHDTFWGRYTDTTLIGAKTPRVSHSYWVTAADFGAKGRKPPITANTLFSRELYEACPINPTWSHGSYEDYEWFWRVTKAGNSVYVSQDLFGWHHHRRGLPRLIAEYKRSSRGCAYFIRAHMDSPFARRRLRQVFIIPIAAAAALAASCAAAMQNTDTRTTAGATLLTCIVMLCGYQVARTRRIEGAAYPAVGLALGLVFTMGLISNLIRPDAGLPLTGEANLQPSMLGSPHRPNWKRALIPLLIVLAIQFTLSLTFIWSNTAFSDEANYLWLGHLESQHWLHGTWWPSAYVYAKLSGSPLIYPPLGALADSLLGLAGARFLSMIFMLGATVLLYQVSLRLVGRGASLLACAIWAVSVPCLKLSFATYDPLSVLFTALSAWLAVRASYTKYRGELVAATAIALALANATAFSGVVISPVVIGFAFLVWLRSMERKQALECTGWLVSVWITVFCALVTVSHTWHAIMYTVFARHTLSFDRNSTVAVLGNVWSWSGIVIVLAAVGAFAAIASETRKQGMILALSAGAVLVVPLAQVHDQTSVSLDKHLAYGVWFGCIAAGYACSKMLQGFTMRRLSAALCCTVALIYPAISGWTSAWQQFHGWANSREFVSALLPLTQVTPGTISIANGAYIPEYYDGGAEGWHYTTNWKRWNTNGLRLDPSGVPPKSWESYYSTKLHTSNYGIIALFYVTNLSSPALPGTMLLSPRNKNSREQLLNLVVANTGHDEPGLAALTTELESDPQYKLAAVGPYNSRYTYGLYAIWQRVTP